MVPPPSPLLSIANHKLKPDVAPASLARSTLGVRTDPFLSYSGGGLHRGDVRNVDAVPLFKLPHRSLARLNPQPWSYMVALNNMDGMCSKRKKLCGFCKEQRAGAEDRAVVLVALCGLSLAFCGWDGSTVSPRNIREYTSTGAQHLGSPRLTGGTSALVHVVTSLLPWQAPPVAGLKGLRLDCDVWAPRYTSVVDLSASGKGAADSTVISDLQINMFMLLRQRLAFRIYFGYTSIS
ncbi:hypothetical protein PG997_004061 [Apiospora hydei]|uniref:Uncharacterized protein n=1 Tax=Apiospora hydei TaxID=1337664 RepID=A0ABR1X146_9PEZI